jgi:FtsH-binding integral membrane protein
MKKLVFTALAVVAFSGAAIAGTQEIKEVITNNDSKAELLVAEEEPSQCELDAVGTYEFFMYEYNNGGDNITRWV